MITYWHLGSGPFIFLLASLYFGITVGCWKTVVAKNTHLSSKLLTVVISMYRLKLQVVQVVLLAGVVLRLRLGGRVIFGRAKSALVWMFIQLSLDASLSCKQCDLVVKWKLVSASLAFVLLFWFLYPVPVPSVAITQHLTFEIFCAICVGLIVSL